MSRIEPVDSLRSRLERVHGLTGTGQVLQAELLCVAILKEFPGQPEATLLLSEFALQRGDTARAVGLLRDAMRAAPGHPQIGTRLAMALLAARDGAQAAQVLETMLTRDPWQCAAWLMLGQLREERGDDLGALQAQFQAVTRAQRQGEWVDEASTPPALLAPVLHAIERLRLGRRELFFGAYHALRLEHGAAALSRVDRALSGYLREWDSRPSDPRQRPKFFYFPDLPNTPYHDPSLQPWAPQLQEAFPRIRAEALRVVEEDRRLPNFVSDHLPVEQFVSGSGPAPSWEAFFFYRHGERFDKNHARCPQTSAVLESIELCRIEGQAPEILFSVLKPGSHINAHHGVTNVRLVMHLPLVVPNDCALNLVDRGEHHWQEGRLVMFDDTYLHEAWNRSDRTRIVLLMDCWNPHLSAIEKLALAPLIETITTLQLADKIARRAEGAG